MRSDNRQSRLLTYKQSKETGQEVEEENESDYKIKQEMEKKNKEI